LVLASNCKNTEKIIKKINQNALDSDQSYLELEYLSKYTAGRLPGTPQFDLAIEHIRQTLTKLGADSVWLIPVDAPGWAEIKKPEVKIILNDKKTINLNSVSLGESVSTTTKGIEAEVVLINTKEQIDSLGENGLKGKIVFFNQKMQVRNDYGIMGWQRVRGASMVSRYGAIGLLVRSLTTKRDNNPHTGVVRYDEKYPQIPAVALSWQAADSLENYLKIAPDLSVSIKTFCNNPGLVPSNNLIAEIKGSDFPNEILLLSAHMDAWHNAQGAQDDGGGVVQIVDVLRIFKELKIRPKHTIRIMAYTDEEQTSKGMEEYARYNLNRPEKHLIDIEVDHGIGIPDGYVIQADSTVFRKQDNWRKYLYKYNWNNIRFSNATDWPLFEKDKTILAYMTCFDDHYFDYHHSENDVFETINKLNLQSGSAALASFIYILDKMDVIDNPKKKNK